MSSIRKISWLVGITGLVLAMASGTGFAATFTPASIFFDECTTSDQVCPSYTDDNPNVTTTGLTGDLGSGPPIVTPSAEGVIVKGTISSTGFFTAIPTGTRSAVLFEGVGSTVISDIVTLTAGEQLCADGCIQDITVTFSSNVDGISLSCPGCPGVAEDGTMQNLSGSSLFNSSTTLIITVRSDPPEAVPAVPEPATLLLLGSGLAGLAGWRRRRLLRSAE